MSKNKRPVRVINQKELRKTGPRSEADKREIVLRSSKVAFRGTLDFMASRLGQGGKHDFMDLIRLAVELEPALETVAAYWEDIPPRERTNFSIDELCSKHAPGLSKARIFGLASQVAMSWGLNAGNMFAGLAHPKMVQTSIKEALRPDGIEDRKIQFQHSGFLPQRGGSPVFNVSATANADADAQSASAARVDSVGLPAFEMETVERAELVRQTEEVKTDATPDKHS